MTSGRWITYFMLASVVIFTIWEFIQLARRRAGNESAYTMSQFISNKIHGKRGETKSRKWLIVATVFSVVVWLVMTWIVLGHWGFICEWFDILCWGR